MARGRRTKSEINEVSVSDYHYDSTRKDNPPAKIAGEGRIPAVPKIQYSYSPRLAPVLRSDPTGTSDRLPELLEAARSRPLTEEEARILAEALRNGELWLEWAGQREARGLTVDPVAFHIHERISAQAIVKVAARQDVTRDRFADPEQDYREAVQFYQHDIDWTNRMILGDSLQVMASLAHREDLAGKIQMIYIDPPYGIKFGSNFQPEVGKRNVKDKESDLIREPEMVKAYRDTWTLGVHSYLAYLRDRLSVAKELLADTGSIFVQISDENLHRVRMVMDEVFGAGNAISVITIVKTSAQEDNLLPSVCDYLLWYSKTIESLKYHQTWVEKTPSDAGTSEYNRVELPDLTRRKMTDEEESAWSLLHEGSRAYRQNNIVSQRPPGDFPVEFEGQIYRPITGYWKSGIEDINRLIKAGRVEKRGKMVSYVRFFNDFSVSDVTASGRQAFPRNRSHLGKRVLLT